MTERTSVRRSRGAPVRLLDCPVCLGVKLAHVELGPGPDLVLDACRRCGGIWFDRGEVTRLGRYRPQALWNKIAPPAEAYRGPCHGCGALMDRNASRCPACGRPNRIECPSCGPGVLLRRHERLELDACDRCQGVWFDAVELARIWNGQLDRLLAGERRAVGRARRPGEVPLVVDALAVDPFLTLWVADVAGGAAAPLAAGAGHLIGAAPEAAAAVVEGTAGLAGSVFEAIAAILEGIFS
jgi:Zn-finger nucleic acid-binding protein